MKIPLKEDAYLLIKDSVVELHGRFGKIRQLDKFETEFVLKSYEAGKRVVNK